VIGKPPDPTRGMSGAIAADFQRQPAALRAAYLEFFADRENRKAAHRDTLEAFIAGWNRHRHSVRRRAA
jgi:hypothetical protein